MTDSNSTDDGLDDWASALAEQTASAAPPPAPAPAPAPVEQAVFQQLPESQARHSNSVDIDRVLDVPVQLTTEIGRTRLTIKNLLQLSQGSVVELDGLAGQPLDVLINGYLIAQGEVVVVNDKFGIRLTDVVTPSERLRRVSKG